MSPSAPDQTSSSASPAAGAAPRLGLRLLESLRAGGTEAELPDPALLALPERIVQFGSGRFLRGFADALIDKANREGFFDGRIVVVQSTGVGRSNAFEEQDGLYTLGVRGLHQGRRVETYAVLPVISRALSANEEWDAVLACARSPEVQCVLSNTTEVGIRLDEEDAPDLNPPRSFPGKLTAFLYARGRAFDYAPDRGLVVLPCELIEQNGARLRQIVLDLARRWKLEERFLEWLASPAFRFCNTLVDRIVTDPPADETEALRRRLGYEDRLLTIAEVYRLWAIEGDAAVVERLGFTRADPGIIVAPDITPYRELKVRILNGTHTITVPVAFLGGHDTVLASLEDPLTAAFIRSVMLEEIVPSLDVDAGAARAFADEVLERFGNPFIEHLLLSITFQSTSKFRHRLVPSILSYYRKRGALPRRILFGFANYLLFMRGTREEEGKIRGLRAGVPYPINDDRAAYFHALWSGIDASDEAQIRGLVDRVCADEELWGTDLTAVPGLSDTVARFLNALLQRGTRSVLQEADFSA